ncbi:fumarylacetoacetate hydrolase family protein [Alteribacillus bidgolensis]|nr:fumarylacetoacetate hydrolase family protein [Alteribacillus bidgolensis]
MDMIKARGLFNNLYQPVEIEVDPQTNNVAYHDKSYSANDLNWSVPVNAAVYGAALNYKGELEKMGDLLHNDPYKAPPKAPILYIKPLNTLTPHQSNIPLPSDVKELQTGAALGIVFKKTATRVNASSASEYIQGFTIVNDISIPHESVHRPAVKQKARDGFCPIGPWVVESDQLSNADNLEVKVYVNNELKQTNSTENLVRNIGTLIEDVTEFMTLFKGDVLLVGTPENPPLLKEGDQVRVEIEGIGKLENSVVTE